MEGTQLIKCMFAALLRAGAEIAYFFVASNIYKHFKFTFCGFGKFLRKNWSDLKALRSLCWGVIELVDSYRNKARLDPPMFPDGSEG